MRSRRAGLKRTGLLALALVLALGALGVAYAAWTDEVNVQGTAETGTLDINPISSSSTFVYKLSTSGTTDHYFIPEGDPDGTEVFIYSNGIEVHYCPGSADQYPPTEGDEPLPVKASAVATYYNTSGDLDEAQMVFTDLFPGIEFRADVGLLYCGTIPAKVHMATIDDPEETLNPTDQLLVDLWNLWKYGDANYDPHEYGIWIDGYHIANDAGPTITYYDSDNLLGVQLHQFEGLDVIMHVLLPNDTAYANQTNLNLRGIISVIQWNEYEEQP